MSPGTRVLSIVFFTAGFFCILFNNSLSFIPGFLAKALLIPLLSALFLINIKTEYNLYDRLLIAGLFFSWAGDVVLEFSGYFIPGLGCFLLAHIMYLTLFFITPGKNVIFRNRWYFLIPVLLSGVLLTGYLYNDLGAMRIPVIVYSIVILTMLTGAINRLEKVNRMSYYLVLTGAILFVISDSAIAINKFSNHFESSGIVVMTTYILAQYLIVIGYIIQRREKFNFRQ
jgi:uncharacterized membrane protein YhhN